MSEIGAYGDRVTSEAKQILSKLHNGKGTEALEQLTQDSIRMSPAEHIRLVQTVLHTPHKPGEDFLAGFAICGDGMKYYISGGDPNYKMPKEPCAASQKLPEKPCSSSQNLFNDDSLPCKLRKIGAGLGTSNHYRILKELKRKDLK